MAESPKPQRSRKVDPTLDPQFSVPAEAEQPGNGERFYQAGWEIVKTILFIVVAALIIRLLLIQPFFVDGESMEPTIRPSDYLIINQLSYKVGGRFKPKRGDVIVFKAPPAPGENYIKRIIGVPGDTVSLKDGRVQVKNAQHPDGVLIDEPYIEQGIPTLPESEETSWTVNEGQYFVLGDNREPGKSSDSRQWGLVPKANIIGKAAVRAYPLSGLGLINHPKYSNLSLAGLLVVIESVDKRA